MNPARAVIDRLGAPLLALAPPLAAVCWAMPEGLAPWRSAGIVSAWAGAGLLVSSLMLMVRSSRLAGLLGGLERMYRWHHRSGLAAYVLLLAHPLALAVNGWVESPKLAWEVLAPWDQSWPLWLGWGALLLLMIGLAATFAVQLAYRLWRMLHPLLGLAALLGLLHIYVLLGEPWPFLGLAMLAALALGWRLLISDLGMAALPYRVQGIVRRAAGTVELDLAPCAGSLAPGPGQFVLVRFEHGPHYRACGEYHPFTVSGTGPGGLLRLTIKALGPCSQRIQGIEAGVLAHVQGPFGCFLQDAPERPQLWVAGGIGITPFIARLRAGPCEQPTTLIYLFRDTADAAFLDELDMLAAADPALHLRTVATGTGLADFATLLAAVADPAQREVFVCGPPGMTAALMPHLRRLGAHGVHAERFAFR